MAANGCECHESPLSVLRSHWTVRKTRLWCCSASACVCWEGELWEQQPIICPGYLVIFLTLYNAVRAG